MLLQRLIPIHQRVYIRSHPLALWFSIGIAVTVTIGLIDPGSVQQTAASLVLPDWLERIFSYTYALGGWFATYGLLRGKPRWEGAGMALLSTGLSVQFLSLLYLAPHLAFPGGSFLVALAIGTGFRAHHLATSAVYV